MAHFAKISEENIVLTVNAVDDGNAASEEKGQAFLERVHGWPEHLWIKTSYNTLANTHKLGGTPFRGNYAGIGYTWDSENEIFWHPQPHASWTKDVSSASWVAPIATPELTSEQQTQNDVDATHLWAYTWDESAYQADNTTGWVLTNLDA
jgi:hypothetical protein